MMASEDDLDMLAGEYVLGALPPDERMAVKRRLLDHPELAQRVAAWEARLAPLSEDLQPVTPRPQVWQQVRRTITASQRDANPSWWNRILIWRLWATGATAAALALLSFVLVMPGEAPQLVAVLNDGRGQPRWVVRASTEARSLATRSLAEPPPVSQVPELWLLPTGGLPPVSLGVLDAVGSQRRAFTAPAQGVLRAGDMLAVSLEPAGGSPTGQPTGPVVSTGMLLAEPR
ncbi:MAG: anti-sigma factor [Geminicoccaceae bacterium]